MRRLGPCVAEFVCDVPCYHPLRAFKSREIGANGKRQIVFDSRQGYADLPIQLPCGQCIGCRLERSRQWAVRCVHEASLHDDNCFATLTFNDAHLPDNGSVSVRDLQLFMKRLRRRFGRGIRFFGCGEYGEINARPHYHVCLFNHDFKDKKLWKIKNDYPLFTSASLQELWPWGFSSLGALTFQSAAYTARYVMKKMTGEPAEAHYHWHDPVTGEVRPRSPEFVTMSRRPGLGLGWLDKYGDDLKGGSGDFVVMNGAKMRPPRYYDEQFEVTDPSHYKASKRSRVRKARKHSANNTPDRLKVREKVQQSRLALLPREIEN